MKPFERVNKADAKAAEAWGFELGQKLGHAAVRLAVPTVKLVVMYYVVKAAVKAVK